MASEAAAAQMKIEDEQPVPDTTPRCGAPLGDGEHGCTLPAEHGGPLHVWRSADGQRSFAWG